MKKKSNKRYWNPREVNWEDDQKMLIELYNTTWINHPITKETHFKWNLIDNFCGNAVGFCAAPADRDDLIAGIYLVLPNRLFMDDHTYDFSVSLYTMTHPSYYKQGIFKELANLTYDKCSEMGIVGVVGVPNNNSLPGFKKALGFDVIGEFEILSRLTIPMFPKKTDIVIKSIKHISVLDAVDLSFISDKARQGTILFERSSDFINWRLLSCPTYDYTIDAALDANDRAVGLIAYRKAIKKGVPITIIMDFLLDSNYKDSEKVANKLIERVNKFAIRSFTPTTIVLVNPSAFESKILQQFGYRKLSKKLLPHESNFILKVVGDFSIEQLQRLKNFNNWYFSFSDYDIF